jgi:hypothetical protein
LVVERQIDHLARIAVLVALVTLVEASGRKHE